MDDLLQQSNLTGRQLLIYAGQRLRPNASLYNTVYTIKWLDLDPLRFKAAWDTLVASCDALRIVVEELNGVPQQRVVAPFPTEIDCADLTHESDVDLALNRWIEARLRRPLVLAERVFDTALVRISEREYVWFLYVHHIVVDGVAVQILLRRVTELYSDPYACAEELPRFSDHTAAVCARRQTEQYRADKKYWLALLQDAPEVLRYYGVDASHTSDHQRVVLRVDNWTGAALTSLASSLATPTMSAHAAAANIFNAVFTAYLSRVTASERISSGVTFHNRTSAVDRRTIGLFMEVFPIVLQVRSDDTLLTLTQQVSARTAQALEHRRYSVAHSARAPSYNGLFNYMSVLATPLGSLEVKRIHSGSASSAVCLNVQPCGETYELWFDVNADVAASSSARRLAEHLRALLTAAIRDPDKPLSKLPLLGRLEVENLLADCTGPAVEWPAGRGGCYAQFESRAAATPNAVALTFDDTHLSYADLNRSANRLARKLRAWGARPGKRVGICLERSPAMVIAVLGVMKSGAAYVPIDPAYPHARLRTLLEDADPVVLVTTKRISDDLPTFAARALCIDQEPASSGPEEGNLTVPVGPDDIAYVMYTSGSTGIPKGVLVTHGGVSNHLCWRNSYFPVEPSDRCLLTASLSFDASVWQILEPLSAGACLTLTRPRFEYDSTYLVKLMLEQSITVACFVPSQLEMVIEQRDIGRCRLRRLTTGGERLSVTLQHRVHERLPATALYNGYGPTEATIASLYWKCVDILGQSSVPIGRPIANTQVHILDQHLQFVPAGVIGEICIGGAGVAEGYLNRPELTAERFLDNALGAASAARLYRTGDLGRVRADGVFEFVGRVDDQVKIRGVRVQLGEIEAAIRCHPDVRSTAVVCTGTTSGMRLTAYVVPRGSNPICAAQLRAFVGERIPPALIPNRFESIRALPLTSSGKLDRCSLPAVSVEEQKSNHIAPRSDLETRLARLWEETIQTRPIGIRDDFFELGGHSLSAVQIAANIERMLGRSVSPGLLFEASTIEMLASRISTFSPNDAGGAFVPLLQGPTGAPLFLIHHVSGDITAYRDLARYLGGKRPVYGVRAPELDSNKEPPDRVEAFASRYVREMRVIQKQGPYLIGGHSAGAHIAFEMAQQLHAAGERVALLAVLEADARTRSRLQSFADAIRFQFEAIRSLPSRQRGLYLCRRFMSWIDQSGKIAPAYVAHSPSTETLKNAVWTAIERAVRDYHPRPYPGSVTLFRATDRSVTRTYTRTLGWGGLARGGIRVIDVAGTHSTVLRPGSEPPMAAKLRACLDELAAGEERAPSALDIRRPPDETGTGLAEALGGQPSGVRRSLERASRSADRPDSSGNN